LNYKSAKSKALERRVIQQEEASRRAEMNVAVSEIDKGLTSG